MCYAQTLGRPRKGQRLHMVSTIGKKLSKLVFILYFGTTNLAITLQFTLDVKLPVSSKLSRGRGRHVMKTAGEREH